MLSVFTLIETIYLKIRAHPLPKNEKRPLPVAVRRSKTFLLKLPNSVSPRINTIVSRDQFKQIRMGENLVVSSNG